MSRFGRFNKCEKCSVKLEEQQQLKQYRGGELALPSHGAGELALPSHRARFGKQPHVNSRYGKVKSDPEMRASVRVKGKEAWN